MADSDSSWRTLPVAPFALGSAPPTQLPSISPTRVATADLLARVVANKSPVVLHQLTHHELSPGYGAVCSLTSVASEDASKW